MLINVKANYRGYFNYLIGGTTKTRHFERQTGKWIMETEKILRKRHGENYRGYMAVVDVRTPAPISVFMEKVNLEVAFKRLTKSFL